MWYIRGLYSLKFLPKCSHHLYCMLLFPESLWSQSQGCKQQSVELQTVCTGLVQVTLIQELTWVSFTLTQTICFLTWITVLHNISLWKYLLQYHLSRHYQNWTCCRRLLLTSFLIGGEVKSYSSHVKINDTIKLSADKVQKIMLSSFQNVSCMFLCRKSSHKHAFLFAYFAATVHTLHIVSFYGQNHSPIIQLL